MAKLAFLLATIALAVFLANATIYRTTVTVDEETGRRWPGERQQTGCQERIRKQNYLKHCQRYIEEKYRGDEDYNRSGSRHLDSCCEQLEDLDKPCRWPGLKQAVQQQMQEGQFGRQEPQELYRVAEKIMQKCNVEPRKCEMPSRSWF